MDDGTGERRMLAGALMAIFPLPLLSFGTGLMFTDQITILGFVVVGLACLATICAAFLVMGAAGTRGRSVLATGVCVTASGVAFLALPSESESFVVFPLVSAVAAAYCALVTPPRGGERSETI